MYCRLLLSVEIMYHNKMGIELVAIQDDMATSICADYKIYIVHFKANHPSFQEYLIYSCISCIAWTIMGEGGRESKLINYGETDLSIVILVAVFFNISLFVVSTCTAALVWLFQVRSLLR